MIMETGLRYETYVIKKMRNVEKTGISRKLHDVNRLTPYVNQLHAFIFGNFNYVNRLTHDVN